MRLLNFIIEKRSNPKLNKKIYTIDILEKYKDNPNVFVSFTDINKLGMNPRSRFNTPLAIYCYPISHVYYLYRDNRSDFATDRDNLQIFEYTGNSLLTEKYTGFDFVNDCVKLQKYASEKISKEYEKDHIWESVVTTAVKTARNRSAFGRIWNLTRLVSLLFEKNSDIYDETLIRKVKKSIDTVKTNNTEIVKWRDVLLYLGYDGAVDDDNGIIHKNEPTQACFFSMKKIKVLEVATNTRKNEYNYFYVINNKKDIDRGIEYLKTNKLNNDSNAINYFLTELLFYKSITTLPNNVAGGIVIGKNLTISWKYIEDLIKQFRCDQMKIFGLILSQNFEFDKMNKEALNILVNRFPESFIVDCISYLIKNLYDFGRSEKHKNTVNGNIVLIIKQLASWISSSSISKIETTFLNTKNDRKKLTKTEIKFTYDNEEYTIENEYLKLLIIPFLGNDRMVETGFVAKNKYLEDCFFDLFKSKDYVYHVYHVELDLKKWLNIDKICYIVNQG